MAEEAVRPYRYCEAGCGVVDQSPRHTVAFPPDSAPTPQSLIDAAIDTASSISPQAVKDVVTQARKNDERSYHMDCHAAAGCLDGTCTAIHELAPGTSVVPGTDLDAEDGITRDGDLLDFIRSGEVNHVGQEASERAAAEQQAIQEAEAAAQGGLQ